MREMWRHTRETQEKKKWRKTKWPQIFLSKNTVFHYITITILLLYCIPVTLFYHRFHVSGKTFMKHLAYFNHKRAVFIKQNNPLELFMELHGTGFRNTFMAIWVTTHKVTSNTTQN